MFLHGGYLWEACYPLYGFPFTVLYTARSSLTNFKSCPSNVLKDCECQQERHPIRICQDTKRSVCTVPVSVIVRLSVGLLDEKTIVHVVVAVNKPSMRSCCCYCSMALSDHKRDSGVQFYSLGLANFTGTSPLGWSMSTLDDVRQRLGHREVGGTIKRVGHLLSDGHPVYGL